ncbi:hypothetical protein [uncultured Bilophila sp.]|uniref:hypothetical protein n=1 Tax=uncultured Bilophila sp. TaxID=529385 RepID=UPI00280C02FB|nr:hypothetical protein [uncultured Bilophila sp.]
MEPISGKHDKKSIVSAYCKNKTTTCHDRTLLVFLSALSWHVVGLSPQHGENTAFFSGFPLGGIPRLTHFAGYPFGASRKKQQPFSMARPSDLWRIAVFSSLRGTIRIAPFHILI